MRTHRLFLYLQRFNTALPALLALLMLTALGWAYVADKRASPRQTVEPPAGTAAGNPSGEPKGPGQVVPLDIRTSRIDAGPNTLLMKIVAKSQSGDSYESEKLETRNLLFMNEGADKAHWLFADASQAITELEALNTKADTLLALYLETVPRPQKASSASSAHTTVYLVSPDGLRKRAIASEIDHTLSHRQHGQTLQLVYQKGKAVRAMRVSLTTFETLSDRVVATLSEVESE
jgi:hypothetical protein